VYRAETEDLVPEDVECIELSERGLIAAVRCHLGNPRHVVKGTTLHRLAFEPSDHGFRATVVLDV
jgi:SHS2 domain-containing protein